MNATGSLVTLLSQQVKSLLCHLLTLCFSRVESVEIGQIIDICYCLHCQKTEQVYKKVVMRLKFMEVNNNSNTAAHLLSIKSLRCYSK